MNCLILSNWSQNIAELHALTAPNKQAYADVHGYTFEDVEMDYSPENHVRWLEIIRDRLSKYDVVMTVGCDILVMNNRIKIEDKIPSQKFDGYKGDEKLIFKPFTQTDTRVVIAREHISWFPINNDVMIWPRGSSSNQILTLLTERSDIWLKYPWLWQADLWDIIQAASTCGLREHPNIRVVEAREMNSTFQPFTIDAAGQARRQNGPSSWYLGDWILHALDMPYEMRLQVIRWGLKFAGDGTYANLPREITGIK